MSSTWVRSAARKSIMPWGSGSSSAELLAAGTGAAVLVGLRGATVPGGATTGSNGLRGRAERSTPVPGSPAGLPGRLVAGLAFGAVFALAGVPGRSAATIAVPSPSGSAPAWACGCALLELAVPAATLLSEVRLLPGPMTAGDTPPGSPATATTFVPMMTREALVLLEPDWPPVAENAPLPATPAAPPMAPQPEKAHLTTAAPPKL